MSKPRWLTGDTVTATTYKCRRLRIPNDLALIMAVNGALLELTEPWRWEQFGTATPDETAALMWQMWQDWHKDTCMIGAIIPYVTTDPPSGALPCDGTTYNRVDYPVLYSLLDSVFIIDADTFQTPDLRGRTIIGAGTGSGLTARSVGDLDGEETHVLTVGELASHDHSYTPPTLNIDLESPGAPDIFAAGIGFPTVTGSTGSDEAHNNMQPFVALNYAVIAT